MIKRPSSKELYDRIRQARILVDDGPIYLVDDAPIIADALDLGYEIAEISKVLKRLLNETPALKFRLKSASNSRGHGHRDRKACVMFYYKDGKDCENIKKL